MTKTRTVETQLEINAPVEAVWKALTEAEEITRWFAPEARVQPGVGGHIWMSWGAPWEGENKIEIWEPTTHLRTSWPFAPPQAKGEAAVPLTVDYYLESRGGKTVLRLVHSGFGTGAGWDEEFDGVRRGWGYELRSLRFYLERHRGTPRRVAWVRRRVYLSPEEAWKRLMSPHGLLKQGAIAGLKEGEAYSVAAPTGDAFRGKVLVNNPPLDFGGSVENLGDALFRLGNEPAGDGGREIWFWLAAYGRPAAEMEALQTRWAAHLRKLFPEAKP
jgi:uncharacterized protein YndB with AHSA1/START domain